MRASAYVAWVLGVVGRGPDPPDGESMDKCACPVLKLVRGVWPEILVGLVEHKLALQAERHVGPFHHQCAVERPGVTVLVITQVR